MPINKDTLVNMLTATAELLRQESPQLNQMDARFGDGNHGEKVGNVADTIQREIGKWQGDDSKSMKDLLAKLGSELTTSGGSNTASWFGTLLSGLAQPLSGNTHEIDASTLKQMLAQGANAMMNATQARVGDKTMMDAILPAADASKNAPDDISQILLSAATAALGGAKQAESFPAQYGKAKEQGQNTVGAPDPGATSMSLFFDGLAKAFQNYQSRT